MKLLVVAHHVVIKEYQELWTQAAELYPELTIEILCPEVYRERGPVRGTSLDAGRVPVHTLPTLFGRAGRQHLHVYRGAARLFDRVRPDFVYLSEEPNSLVTRQLLAVAKKRGIPALFWTSLAQLRDYKQRYSVWNPRRVLFQRCQDYAFAHAQGAVATSAAARDVLRERGFAGPIVQRPTHGVGADFLDLGQKRVAQSSVECQAAADRPLQIGFVGHFEPVKGIDILLDAFSRMRTQGRAELILRGEGALETDLRAAAKALGIDARVRWERFVPYEQMPALFGELDVLVLPSLERGGVSEKFGRVLVEGMASGAVGVGSQHGGIPLALAGGGVLFPAGHPAALARELDRLNKDTAHRRERQRAGFEAARDTYGYRALAQALVEGMREQLGWLGAA